MPESPPLDPDRLRRLLASELPALKLTPRLEDIFVLICAGRTNAQIAIRLRIALGTVETEAKLLFGRLGVSGRRGARSLCVRVLADRLENSSPEPD